MLNTFTWYRNGNEITGETSKPVTFAATTNDLGDYTCKTGTSDISATVTLTGTR